MKIWSLSFLLLLSAVHRRSSLLLCTNCFPRGCLKNRSLSSWQGNKKLMRVLATVQELTISYRMPIYIKNIDRISVSSWQQWVMQQVEGRIRALPSSSKKDERWLSVILILSDFDFYLQHIQKYTLEKNRRGWNSLIQNSVTVCIVPSLSSEVTTSSPVTACDQW